jgi:hypothetical protein
VIHRTRTRATAVCVRARECACVCNPALLCLGMRDGAFRFGLCAESNEKNNNPRRRRERTGIFVQLRRRLVVGLPAHEGGAHLLVALLEELIGGLRHDGDHRERGVLLFVRELRSDGLFCQNSQN